MSYTLISAYTVHTPYEEEYKSFKASLEKQGITNYKVYPLVPTGSWVKNAQLKAKSILQALNELNTDVLWVDIDAEIRGDISYFDTLNCDICCYYLKTRWDSNELLSGTFYFANNDKVKKLVQDWISTNDKNQEWDQKNLQKLVDSRDINKVIMPADYIVVDRIYHQWQTVKDIKIYHKQASRQNRNKKL